MKTGNGYTPNPMGRFKGGMKRDTSNMSKKSNGASFNAGKSVLARTKGSKHGTKK